MVGNQIDDVMTEDVKAFAFCPPPSRQSPDKYRAHALDHLATSILRTNVRPPARSLTKYTPLAIGRAPLRPSHSAR